MLRRFRTACTMAALAAVLAVRLSAASTLAHLHGIEEIRDWFNANSGHVRVILLLSPT